MVLVFIAGLRILLVKDSVFYNEKFQSGKNSFKNAVFDHYLQIFIFSWHLRHLIVLAR